MQVADAGVVAEAFPKFVDFVGTGFREGFDGGQFAHPAFPVRDHGFDLGLLQHDFGNPNGVGIAGAAPGEVAGVAGEPGKEQRD